MEQRVAVQPELWVDAPRDALAFYAAAFGATVLHLVGEGDDIVAQLGVGDGAFWIAPPSPAMERLSPHELGGGATGRTLLVVEDPRAVVAAAVAAGASERSPVADEHGWLIGRVVDPFGHEWEIGRPTG